MYFICKQMGMFAMAVNVMMHLLQECAWCSTSNINTGNIFVPDFFNIFLILKHTW